MASTPTIAVAGVGKTYGPVRALHDVSLAFCAGQVHGLVGENGAGKSTLMKLLAGIETPTTGHITCAGQMVTWRGPADALHHGVAMIHQELNLIDDLSVADNILLGRERTAWGGWVRRQTTLAEADAALGRLHFSLNGRRMVRTLSVAQKQMVEIAKALSCRAQVLILDEPTAVLSQHEAAALFALIKELKTQGVAVIYISHHLAEVLNLCDVVTVLRDGQVVTTVRVAPQAGDTSIALAGRPPVAPTPAHTDAGGMETLTAGPEGERRLANLMVGRTLGDHFPPRAPASERVVLQVRNVAVPGYVEQASVQVHAGEIVGLAGLVGAGRTELAEALAGLRRRSSGQVTMDGQSWRPATPAQAVHGGLAYVSEDRRGAGLVLGMDITANITLVSLRRYSRLLIRRRAEEQAAQRRVADLGIKLGALRDPIETLSGGNQQKVALAKWLEVTPKVLILDEPTRGVDIGAKAEIYRLIQRLAAGGMACLLISSEMNELLGLCHRITVMRQGRTVAELDGPTATEETILYHAAGVGGR